ncbi:serine/threonine-protein kinase ULK3 [Pelomyxa schiedti]|nr:serine/threonine-protein kinase ULK3 [Pelomyxa schiedti]
MLRRAEPRKTGKLKTAASGAYIAPPAQLPIGRILTSPKTDLSYRITDLVGTGLYGTVYRATREGEISRKCKYARNTLRFGGTKTNIVALKVIQKAVIPPIAMKYLQQEVNILTQSRHQNICALHESWDTSELHIVVMEYCSGGSLANYTVASKRQPEGILSLWFAQLADALRTIHLLEIVHRDIKPDNILLSDPLEHTPASQVVIKLCDFGFASVSKPTSSSVVGTQKYIPPEVWTGSYTDSVDLWSLGITLGQMVGVETENSTPQFGEVAISNDCRALITHLVQPVDKRISWADFFAHPFVTPNCCQVHWIENPIESCDLPVVRCHRFPREGERPCEVKQLEIEKWSGIPQERQRIVSISKPAVQHVYMLDSLTSTSIFSGVQHKCAIEEIPDSDVRSANEKAKLLLEECFYSAKCHLISQREMSDYINGFSEAYKVSEESNPLFALLVANYKKFQEKQTQLDSQTCSNLLPLIFPWPEFGTLEKICSDVEERNNRVNRVKAYVDNISSVIKGLTADQPINREKCTAMRNELVSECCTQTMYLWKSIEVLTQIASHIAELNSTPKRAEEVLADQERVLALLDILIAETKLQQENSQLQQENSQLHQQHTEEIAQRQLINQQHDASRHHIETLENRCRQLSQQCSDLERKNSELTDRGRDLVKERDDLHKANRQLENKSNQLENKINQLEHRNSDLLQLIETLNIKITDLETKLSVAQTEVKKATEKILSLASLLQQL